MSEDVQRSSSRHASWWSAGLRTSTIAALLIPSLLIVLGVVLPVVYFPAYPDPFTASKWSALLFVVPLAALFGSANLARQKYLWLTLVLLSAPIALSAVYNHHSFAFWQLPVAQLIVFALLLFLYVPLIQKKKFRRSLSLLLGASAILTIGLTLYLSPFPAKPDDLNGPFGFKNITAEFLILLLGLIFSIRLSGSRLVWQLLVGVTSILITVILSRSTLMGLAMLISIGFLMGGSRRKLAVACGAGFAIGLIYCAALGVFSADAGKAVSGLERLNLYKGTLALIRANPMGIGTGQFEFGALPYLREYGLIRPFFVYKSPHSEPLRLVAENGWLMVFVLLAASYLILRSLRVKRFQVRLPILLAIIPEFLFQFPLELSSSTFLMALGLSFFLPRRSEVQHWIWRPALIFIASGVLVFATIDLLSNISSPAQLPREYSHRLCRLNPYNWRICQDSIQSLATSRRFSEAREVAVSQLRLRPWNTSLLRLWATVEMNGNDSDIACDIQEQVLGLFISDPIADIGCGFTFVDREQIFQGYRKWVAEVARGGL